MSDFAGKTAPSEPSSARPTGAFASPAEVALTLAVDAINARNRLPVGFRTVPQP